MFETREIERHLIKLLVTNKVISRQYIHNLEPELFTGIRKSIVGIVQEIFDISPTVVSDELFIAELDKRYSDDDSSKTRNLTEWKLIKNATVEEDIEVLHSKLVERSKSENVALICERTLEFLKTGNVNDAIAVLQGESAKISTQVGEEKPVVDLFEYEDVLQDIKDRRDNPEKYKGLKTGFKAIDFKLGGLFNAELFLIAAVTGVGKSTLLKQLAKGVMLNNHNVNILHVTNEEHREQVRMKYFALFSDTDYFKFKMANMSDEELGSFEGAMKRVKIGDRGRIFIKEIPQFASVAEIYREVYNLEKRGHKIDFIVIDYMDHLGPVQKSWSENDEQAKVGFDCKGLAVDLNVAVATATQAATVVATKQEKGKHFGQLDVYGSKRRIHASNVFFGIMHCGEDDSQLVENGGDRETLEECDNYWKIECLKSRDGAKFIFECRHKVHSGEVLEEYWSGGVSKLSKELEELETVENQKKFEDNQEKVREENTSELAEKPQENADSGDIGDESKVQPKIGRILSRLKR